MPKMWAIYRRELAYFFNSTVAYVVTAVFLVLAGYFFYNLLGYFNLLSMQTMQNPAMAGKLSLTEGLLQPLFGNMCIIILLTLPFLTMRLLAEERSSGTAELLFTYPITDWDAILGKYLATLTVYASMLGLTLLYPLLLFKYANPELGPIISGYLGLFMVGMAITAMGLFFSSLGDNQMIAGIMTFGAALLLVVIGWITPFVKPGVAEVLNQLSVLQHLTGFSRGVVDTNDVIFYLNFSAFFLFMCARVLDSHRWRS